MASGNDYDDDYNVDDDDDDDHDDVDNDDEDDDDGDDDDDDDDDNCIWVSFCRTEKMSYHINKFMHLQPLLHCNFI